MNSAIFKAILYALHLNEILCHKNKILCNFSSSTSSEECFYFSFCVASTANELVQLWSRYLSTLVHILCRDKSLIAVWWYVPTSEAFLFFSCWKWLSQQQQLCCVVFIVSATHCTWRRAADSHPTSNESSEFMSMTAITAWSEQD